MSNLPPGVRVSDLPGNGPDEIAWEHLLEALDASPLLGTDILQRCGIDVDRETVYERLATSRLSIDEIRERCDV